MLIALAQASEPFRVFSECPSCHAVSLGHSRIQTPDTSTPRFAWSTDPHLQEFPEGEVPREMCCLRSHHKKMPQTRLRQQKLIVPQLWRLEDKSLAGSEASLEMVTFSLCSHVAFLLCSHIPSVLCVHSPSYKNTNQIESGPIFIASFNPRYLSKAIVFKCSHILRYGG